MRVISQINLKYWGIGYFFIRNKSGIKLNKNNQYESNSFLSDVGKLASGSFFAQLILILTVPFLTRIYAPAEFGLIALFVSITSVLAGISCLCYEFTIMLPKSEKEAANLFAVSLMFVICESRWGQTPKVEND